MSRKTLVLPIPYLTPEKRQVVTLGISVFVVAFVSSIIANQTSLLHLNTALSALGAAAAAGVVALAHYIFDIVPTPAQVKDGVQSKAGKVGLVLASKSQFYTVAVSAGITFATILGSQLVAGAAHAESLPDLKAVFLSAIAAAVTGVFTYAFGLIPAPKAPATIP